MQDVFEWLKDLLRMISRFELVCQVAEFLFFLLSSAHQAAQVKQTLQIFVQSNYWSNCSLYELNRVCTLSASLFKIQWMCLLWASSKFLRVNPPQSLTAPVIEELFLNLCVLIGHCITVQIKYNLLISLEWHNLVEALHRWTNLERPLSGVASPRPNLPDSNSTTATLHNTVPWPGPPFRGLMHPSIAWSCPEVSVTAFYGTCMHACILSVCVSHTAHTRVCETSALSAVQ